MPKKNKENEEIKKDTDIFQDLENIHEIKKNIYEKIDKIWSNIEHKCAFFLLNDAKRNKKIYDLLVKQFGQKRMLLLLMIDPKSDKTELQSEYLQSLRKKLSEDLEIQLSREIPCSDTPKVTIETITKNLLDEKMASKSVDLLEVWLQEGMADTHELKTPLDRVIACYAFALSCNFEKYSKIVTPILKAINVRGGIKVEDFTRKTLLRLAEIIYPACEHREEVHPTLELALMQQVLLREKTELDRDEYGEEVKIQKKIVQDYLDENNLLRERFSVQETRISELETLTSDKQSQIYNLEETNDNLNNQVKEALRETRIATDRLEYEKKKYESIYQSTYQGKLEELIAEVDHHFVRIKETLSRVEEREKNSIERRLNALIEKLQELKGVKDGENRD